MMQVMKDIGGVEMPEYIGQADAGRRRAKVEPVANGQATVKVEAKHDDPQMPQIAPVRHQMRIRLRNRVICG